MNATLALVILHMYCYVQELCRAGWELAGGLATRLWAEVTALAERRLPTGAQDTIRDTILPHNSRLFLFLFLAGLGTFGCGDDFVRLQRAQDRSARFPS